MESKAITIKEVSLTARQTKEIGFPTPIEFVKQRKIKGGGTANYVEVGYVVARLNQIFSPIGWDFEVVDQGVETKEVWVKGKLTVKDNKGFQVSKTQYGQHERFDKVALGDTLKSAASDALKKCASLFGVASDVYWADMEGAKTPRAEKSKNEKPKEANKDELFKTAKQLVLACRDIQMLIEWREKIGSSKLYDNQQKIELMGLINAKINAKI